MTYGDSDGETSNDDGMIVWRQWPMTMMTNDDNVMTTNDNEMVLIMIVLIMKWAGINGNIKQWWKLMKPMIMIMKNQCVWKWQWRKVMIVMILMILIIN